MARKNDLVEFAIDWTCPDCGQECCECSPTNLQYARTHEQLAQRKPRPVNEGLSFREPLNTKDYGCLE